MGMMKRYLESLVCDCGGDNKEHQDAIEWAIMSGWLKLTYKREEDVALIEATLNETLVAYRQTVRSNEAVLMQAYEQSGFMEEILKAV